MAAVFAALRSPVLLVFSLAAAPSHQSSLFVFVRQFPPQGHLTVGRLGSDEIRLEETAARPWEYEIFSVVEMRNIFSVGNL